MLPFVITAIGVATISMLTASSIYRDIKQEERRLKCLELVRKGKVKPDYCTKMEEKSVIEDLRKTIGDAGKMALTGGALYLLAKFIEKRRKK